MRVPPSEGGDLVSELATYLKDHLAGARGGMHLFWGVAGGVIVVGLLASMIPWRRQTSLTVDHQPVEEDS